MSDPRTPDPATRAATPGPGPALLRPMRVRDFRLLFGGEMISLLGDQFHFIALAWLTLQLTGSGLALGSVLMVSAVPRIAFMLVGGASSDRMSPRTLMVVSNLARGLTVSVLAVLVLTDHVALWQLYLLAVVFGIADAFFMPAINTVLPMLIPDEGLPAANGLMQVAQQMTGLIGPAIAGVAVALVGSGIAFSIDAGSFAVSTVTALALVGGRRSPANEGAGSSNGAAMRGAILTSIREGLAHAWRDPAIRSLVLITAAINFAFGGPVNVGLPWLAKNAYGGAAALGFVIAAFGGGALLGATVAGSLPTVHRLGTVVSILVLVMGVAFGFMGALPSAVPAAALLSVVGVGAGFANVQVIAWLQARTPEELRGRVMSLVMLGSHGLYPISLAIAGVVVDLGAAPLLFAAGGAVIVVAMLVGMSSGVVGRMNAPAPSRAAGSGAMEGEAAS